MQDYFPIDYAFQRITNMDFQKKTKSSLFIIRLFILYLIKYLSLSETSHCEEKPLCIKITGLMPLTFFNRTTMGAWLGITFPSVSCVLIHKCVTVSFFILLKKNWKLSPFSWLIFVGLWLNSFYCLYYDSFVWRIIVICIDHYTFFCWYYFFGKIS